MLLVYTKIIEMEIAMNKSEMRHIAGGAVRSEARRTGRNPDELTTKEALQILDDLYRMEPALIAAMWYGEASDNQIKLFEREWRQ